MQRNHSDDIEPTQRSNTTSRTSNNAFVPPDMFTLKYPIIQAPIGGIATPELAAAVSNAGGLGGLALSWSSPEDAEEKIRRYRALSSQPFYVNFVLNFGANALERSLSLGVKIIQFSWGMPSEAMVELIRAHGAHMGIQVTSADSAARALALGADYLICQGTQAGGHVQASKPLEQALAEVLNTVPDTIPVFASGGISSGTDLHRYLQLSATGIVMGSRFVASVESTAHQQYKEALVNSVSEDTVLTSCMNKGWENTTSRIVRNSTFRTWETEGCASPGHRPGEQDVLGQTANGKEIARYSISAPTVGVIGQIEAMTCYAGTSVDGIHDIRSAGTIVEDVWREYEAVSR